jgi:hypothetical protein
MGLLVSTPPSERTVADLMFPSVVGTEAATPCSQLLHRRYAKSEWAAKTKYHY